ncbi:MAG: PAS domain S-box protein, partial [Bacteroidota bacterium]|nr:PAS domain S-box protein [Bacteroidota bacterium]
LNSEYQKFQNVVYEIFSEYKKEYINLQNISRIFDYETEAYVDILKTLENLRKNNNYSFKNNINQIETSSANLRIIAFINIIVFLSILSFLTYLFFGSDVKSNYTLKELLKKLSSGEFVDEKDINQNITKNTLVPFIKKINDKNKRINYYVKELKNKNYKLSLDKEKNRKDTIFTSIAGLTKELIESNKKAEVRKIEDQQKEWANKGYNLFSEIMRKYANDLNKLSDEVIKNFVNYINASIGGLFIVKEDEESLYLDLLAAFAYDRKKHNTKKIKFGEGLIGTVATDQSAVILNDIPEEYIEIEAGLGNTTPNSLLLLPLLTDSGLMGVIEIASLKPLKNYEIEFAEVLSKSIATTLESVKINEKTIELLKESQKQSDELASREKALQETMQEVSKAHEVARKNEIEMRGILSGVDQTLMRAEYTPSGTFINSNMVHRRVMGYDIETMRGKNILEFIQEEEKANFKSMWAEVAGGRPYQITVKRKNQQTGIDLWLLNQYTPIKDDKGKVIKTLYLAIDITEQKQAEEKANNLLIEAREKELKLEGILTGVDRTILRAEYTPEGIFQNANDIHTKILGYHKKEMIGKSILEFIENKDEKESFKTFWKEIQAGKAKELIVKRINKSTNRDIWLINQYNPIFDDKGKLIQILYLAIDITEQKTSEEKIGQLLSNTQEKETELKGLFSAVDQTLMRAEYSPDGKFIDANEIHHTTLGYNLEEMKGKNILTFINENEKNDFLKTWNNVRKGSLEQLTVKRKNFQTGKNIWLLNQYTPIENDKGEIIKILYLATDITEQKEIEQKARELLTNTREKESRLTGILNGVDETILRAAFSPDGIFILNNNIYTETLGIEEDLTGKNILEYIPEDEHDDFKHILETVKSGNTAQATVKRKNKKTNTEIWLLNQFTPVTDTEGKLFRILYLGIDITEQKQAEEMASELLIESKAKEDELETIISAVDNTLMRAKYKVDGTFIDSNDFHKKIMGYKIDDMLGKNIHSFIPEN